jgi:hypothetical protein
MGSTQALIIGTLHSPCTNSEAFLCCFSLCTRRLGFPHDLLSHDESHPICMPTAPVLDMRHWQWMHIWSQSQYTFP